MTPTIAVAKIRNYLLRLHVHQLLHEACQVDWRLAQVGASTLRTRDIRSAKRCFEHELQPSAQDMLASARLRHVEQSRNSPSPAAAARRQTLSDQRAGAAAAEPVPHCPQPGLQSAPRHPSWTTWLQTAAQRPRRQAQLPARQAAAQRGRADAVGFLGQWAAGRLRSLAAACAPSTADRRARPPGRPDAAAGAARPEQKCQSIRCKSGRKHP